MQHPCDKTYLTEEGVIMFQKELKRLEELRRTKIENPDEDQDEILFLNRKIEEIATILKTCDIIKPPNPRESDTVCLGATVHVEHNGKTSELTLVGTLEANPLVGKISNESPVGRALLGKKAGDVVLVSEKTGAAYAIRTVSYPLWGKKARTQKA